jgi:hypothetical protein
MKRDLRVLAATGSLSLALAATDAAFAQKAGGILVFRSNHMIQQRGAVGWVE